MDIYKIKKGNWSGETKAESLEDAQAFADSLGEGYTAEYYAPYVPPTYEEQLAADVAFCRMLTERFVLENRQAGVTTEQSAALLLKFKDIMSMAQIGAVSSVYALLQNVVVDEIYTQARKDRDLQDIENYIAQ